MPPGMIFNLAFLKVQFTLGAGSFVVPQVLTRLMELRWDQLRCSLFFTKFSADLRRTCIDLRN